MYAAVHDALFKAYFSECTDIGDMAVLLDMGGLCDLDPKELGKSLAAGTYTERVRQGSRDAKALRVTAVPSFFIEDLPVITGAVSEERFRSTLQSITER